MEFCLGKKQSLMRLLSLPYTYPLQQVQRFAKVSIFFHLPHGGIGDTGKNYSFQHQKTKLT